MTFVIHRIRLREGVPAHRFETWVREVDYETCPHLPSVLSFSVQRAVTPSGAPPAGFDYFEIIEVSGVKEFERDMESEVFQGLEQAFGLMAEVVDETAGETVGTGYRAR